MPHLSCPDACAYAYDSLPASPSLTSLVYILLAGTNLVANAPPSSRRRDGAQLGMLLDTMAGEVSNTSSRADDLASISEIPGDMSGE